MKRNPFAPALADLPQMLPIFPLADVLLLPTGNLPLNIFEPQYLRMVEDVLRTHRMIGMIQPRPGSAASALKPPVYDIGCAGKITEFTELPDGRYLVSLNGISRFRALREMDAATPYRQVVPEWAPFEKDMEMVGCLNLDRARLHGMLQTYFSDQELQCDWTKVEEATDERLITCLSMICPFDAKEKQALLEAPCCRTRAEIFMTMLEMAVQAGRHGQGCRSKH